MKFAKAKDWDTLEMSVKKWRSGHPTHPCLPSEAVSGRNGKAKRGKRVEEKGQAGFFIWLGLAGKES